MIGSLRRNLDMHMLWFAVLVITIGVLYLRFVPNNEIPDATGHFATSYALANKLMGQESDLESGDARGVKGLRTVNMIIRECDKILFIPNSEDDAQGNFLIKKTDNIYLEYPIYTYSPFPTYIIDAVVIAFGREIHLSPWALLNLVRYVNLFVYMGLGILTLKIFSLGKDLMSVIFLLPAGIQRASATSHESLYYAFVWFYIAFVLHMAYEVEELGKREMILLLVCSILIAPIKGLGIGYVLLIFLIKKGKIEINIKGRGKNSLLFIFAICVAVWLFYNLMVNNPGNIISSNNGERFIEYADSEAVYLTDLLLNPIHFIRIIIRTFMRWGVYFTETLVSVYGNINLGGGNGIFAYVFATLFVMSSFLTECDSKEINTKERLWIAGIFLFIYGLQCILTIFSFGGKAAEYGEVKGAYMMPCIPLLGLMIKGQFLRYYRSNRTLIIMIAETIVHIMALCYILF